jgi:hypothetical protein
MTEAEELALHLVGVHCDPMAIARPHSENVDQHQHEHRDHDSGWLGYDAAKVEAVLEEAEAAG